MIALFHILGLIIIIFIAFLCFAIPKWWINNWSHPLNLYTDWLYKYGGNPFVRSRKIKVNEGFGTYWKTIYWFETINGCQLTPTEMYDIYVNGIKK